MSTNNNQPKSQKVDFLIIPQGTSKVFNLSLSTGALFFLRLVLFLFLFLTGFIFFHFFKGQQSLANFRKTLIFSEYNDVELKKVFKYLGLQREVLHNFSRMDEKLRVILGLNEYGQSPGNLNTNYFETNPQLSSVEVLPTNFSLNDIGRYNEENRLILSLRKKSLEDLRSYVFEQQNILLYTPSIKPVKVGYLTSGYGLRVDPFFGVQRMHYGLDWAFLPHTPIYATAYGIVKRVYSSLSYGNVVIIDHQNGIETFYAHLASASVKIGQKVKRGQMIARMGNTGKRSTGTHLHYEVLLNGKPVDPVNYILEDLPAVSNEFIVEF